MDAFEDGTSSSKIKVRSYYCNQQILKRQNFYFEGKYSLFPVHVKLFSFTTARQQVVINWSLGLAANGDLRMRAQDRQPLYPNQKN